ncbi:hypothetical protein [Streptomyces sp. NPDC058755]|uniref:hypothetical protein n=1 Tax=Streptomyces sp. NPDC058755 TaxID=3346624 RepID=UPI003686A787
MTASPALRSLRAAVFAAVCVLLAAAGHGLATGDMPPVWADGAGFLGVFLTGWLLCGRERSLMGIGAVMLSTQAGLHTAFDAAHAHAVASAHGMRTALDGHAVAVMGHTHSVSGLATAAAAHAHTMSTPATAAHLLAALIASWWLRRGEAALWALLRRAVAFVPGLVAWWRDAPLPAPAGRILCLPAGPEPSRRPTLRHAVSRRGPPAPIPYPS